MPEISLNPDTHLIRVEGVNLSSFIDDTNDLNTQRGAGLILLDAVKTVVPSILSELHVDNQIISQGASVGLYLVETEEPDKLNKEIAEKLQLHPQCATATFLVGIEKIGDAAKYVSVSETLLAHLRTEQYAMSSLSFPAVSPQIGICELDGLRPKKADLDPNEKDRKQKNCSEAVRIKRNYGQQQKQAFYSEITEHAGLGIFAQSFEDIACGAAENCKLLDNKLAVFYADGNSFSEHFRASIKNAKNPMEKHREIDERVLSNRKKWLADFLLKEVLENAKPWMGKIHEGAHKGEDCYRFETLLWGGDEVMFVMPAWKGWAFARHFFSMASDWKLNVTEHEETTLTHTAGLVFCHHKAPINRLKALAREMVDAAKNRKGKNGDREGRKRDELLVTVLESFDHLGGDYSGAIKRRYHDNFGFADMILGSDSLAASLEELANLRAKLSVSNDFPRSQLRLLVRGIIQGTKTAKDREHSFRNASKTDRENLELWIRATGFSDAAAKADAKADADAIAKANASALILLEELWDYALS